MSSTRGKLARLERARAYQYRIEVDADEAGRPGGRTYAGHVLALGIEHGGRGAVKLVLTDDRGIVYVIGLTMIRAIRDVGA